MPTLYEYGSDGFYVGWHTDLDRPSSTPLSPDPIPPARAKWDGTQWVEDASREAQQLADEATARTRLQQAIATCKAYNPNTATAAEVRATLGASLFLLKRLYQELN